MYLGVVKENLNFHGILMLNSVYLRAKVEKLSIAMTTGLLITNYLKCLNTHRIGEISTTPMNAVHEFVSKTKNQGFDGKSSIVPNGFQSASVGWSNHLQLTDRVKNLPIKTQTFTPVCE